MKIKTQIKSGSEGIASGNRTYEPIQNCFEPDGVEHIDHWSQRT